MAGDLTNELLHVICSLIPGVKISEADEMEFFGDIVDRALELEWMIRTSTTRYSLDTIEGFEAARETVNLDHFNQAMIVDLETKKLLRDGRQVKVGSDGIIGNRVLVFEPALRFFKNVDWAELSKIHFRRRHRRGSVRKERLGDIISKIRISNDVRESRGASA